MGPALRAKLSSVKQVDTIWLGRGNMRRVGKIVCHDKVLHLLENMQQVSRLLPVSQASALQASSKDGSNSCRTARHQLSTLTPTLLIICHAAAVTNPGPADALKNFKPHCTIQNCNIDNNSLHCYTGRSGTCRGPSPSRFRTSSSHDITDRLLCCCCDRLGTC